MGTETVTRKDKKRMGGEASISFNELRSRCFGLVGVVSVCLYLISGSLLRAGSAAAAERDDRSTLFCGACIALVDELNWQTGITDPKKKIQIGNYRLNAKGDLTLNEVPLATSEIHLTEIFESVCRYMWAYVMRTAPNGDVYYILKTSREGGPISREYITESDEIKRSLQFTCDTILEEHDDWMIKLYQARDEEMAEKLCVTRAGLCTKENVTEQVWAYASAVMLGMTEFMPKVKEDKPVPSSDESTDDDVEEASTTSEDHDDITDDDVDIDADANDVTNVANERTEL